VNQSRESGAVELVDLTKRFGQGEHTVVAVDGVRLTIDGGEFFSLLGPSGSGKTTVLRLIAGFEQPDAGAVLLGGQDVTSRPPYQRDVNTVFQDYALFPHLSVQENVEYGLRVKRVAKSERRRRAAEMLEVVRLGTFGRRRPDQLSGGQRQRVALARALVNRPKVLLLDEPLGALDLKLREEMQVELKSIQHDVGITFVLVTHDQGEALSMSTRVAVFNQGRVEQVGTPAEIYERPATTFVAQFVGTANLLDDAASRRVLARPGVHAIRPERLRLTTHPPESPAVAGTVADVQYLGAESRVRVDLEGGGRLIASAPSPAQVLPGDTVWLTWPEDAPRAVDPNLTTTSPEGKGP
jgi:putative spermidine/putrescine transport system ATP-binding protein